MEMTVVIVGAVCIVVGSVIGAVIGYAFASPPEVDRALEARLSAIETLALSTKYELAIAKDKMTRG